MFTEVSEIDVEIFRTELDAHQERPESASACSSACGMLPLLPVDEVRNRRDFAFAWGQAGQENSTILHVACAERSSC